MVTKYLIRGFLRQNIALYKGAYHNLTIETLKKYVKKVGTEEGLVHCTIQLPK